MSSPQTTSARGASPTILVRWMVVLLLATVLVALWTELLRAQPAAMAQSTGSESGTGMFALAGQVTRDTYGLYLVDTERKTVCVYQWLPGSRKLRLMAARSVAFDLSLEDFNTEPSPKEIRKLIGAAEPIRPNRPK